MAIAYRSPNLNVKLNQFPLTCDPTPLHPFGEFVGRFVPSRRAFLKRHFHSELVGSDVAQRSVGSVQILSHFGFSRDSGYLVLLRG